MQELQTRNALPSSSFYPTAHAGAISSDIVREAKNAPFLEADEESALAIDWRERDNQQALHKMTRAHIRLVIAQAAKFRRYNLPLNDLVQEGTVGLMEAAARYEPGRQVRFSTYAIWWIRASMQDYILRNWSIVRGGTSSAQKTLFFNLRRLRAQLIQEDETISSEALYTHIAEAVGVSKKDVELMAHRLSGSDNALDAVVAQSENNTTYMDFLTDEGALPDELTSEMIDGERRHNALHEALTHLNQRELYIIKARHLNDQALTLEVLGEELRISKERVRQIEMRAIEKLRILMTVN